MNNYQDYSAPIATPRRRQVPPMGLNAGDFSHPFVSQNITPYPAPMLQPQARAAGGANQPPSAPIMPTLPGYPGDPLRTGPFAPSPMSQVAMQRQRSANAVAPTDFALPSQMHPQQLTSPAPYMQGPPAPASAPMVLGSTTRPAPQFQDSPMLTDANALAGNARRHISAGDYPNLPGMQQQQQGLSNVADANTRANQTAGAQAGLAGAAGQALVTNANANATAAAGGVGQNKSLQQQHAAAVKEVARLQGLLEKANSVPGKNGAATQVAETKAMSEQDKAFSGGLEKIITNEMMSPEEKQAAVELWHRAHGRSMQGQQPGGQGQPVTRTSEGADPFDAEYAKIKSGEEFTGPDGVRRRKP